MAVANFYKALATYRTINVTDDRQIRCRVANVYTNLGVVYGLRKMHSKEIELFTKALHLNIDVRALRTICYVYFLDRAPLANPSGWFWVQLPYYIEPFILCTAYTLCSPAWSFQL